MKQNILKAFAAATLLAAAGNANAQVALRSGYFSEGYSYRHQLNPALAPDRAYVSIPILSGITFGTQSNIGLENFLYDDGKGGLNLFTNKAVSSSDFLGKLKDNNRIGLDINVNLLSVGFHKWGGFNSFDLSLRSNSAFNMPKGLFEFVKTASSGNSYDFSDLNITSTSYMEMAFGHSRRLNDEWRVGGKLKILLGIMDVDTRVDNMTATLHDDMWSISGQGHMDIAMKGLTMKTKPDSKKFDFGEIDMDGAGLSGAGFAVDLGATYRPQVVEGLEVSAALNDLGFINWKNNTNGVMNTTWEFRGFNISQDDKDGNQYNGQTYNSFDTEISNLGDDLEDCFNFEKDESKTSRSRMLGATLNIGASYILPQYDKLKFGFLSSTRINGPYTWSEGRFSANIAPVKCLDFTLNYAASTFGHSLGWLLNVHTKGFGLFVGSDHQFFKMTPQCLPAGKVNMNLQFGINFPFGKQHSDKL